MNNKIILVGDGDDKSESIRGTHAFFPLASQFPLEDKSFFPYKYLNAMGNRTMGLSATAHQIAKPSGSPHMIQRRETTKQRNGSVYGKEELVVKNRFETLTRLVNVES